MFPTASRTSRRQTRGLLVGATAWQGLAAAVTQAIFAVVTLVAARVTTPSEFALWGLAAIVLNAQYLVRLGLGQALIAVVDDRELRRAFDSAFALTTTLALGLSVIMWTVAPRVAGTFGNGLDKTDVVAALEIVSVALFFATLESVPLGILERALAFRPRSIAEIALTSAYGVCACVLLGLGAGVWSLIVGRALLCVGRFGIFQMLSPIRPRARAQIDLALMGRLLRYGLPLGIAGIVGFITTNVDTALVGRVSGARELGAYALAFTVATLLPTFLANTIVRVSFAVYASVARERPEERDESFSNALVAQFDILLPVTLALALFGPSALVEVFGGRWAAAGHLLPILALYGAFQASGTALTSLLAAAGRPTPQFVGQSVALIVSILLTAYLYRSGAPGIAWAFTAGQAAFFLAAARSAALIWPRGLLLRLRTATFSAASAAIMGFVLLRYFPDAINGVAAISGFGLSYTAVFIIVRPALAKKLLRYV